MNEIRRVAVIGAGPSGLAAAKVLLEAGLEVTVFEAQMGVGGAFRNRSYEGAELVSSKYLTAFSDFRWTEASDHPKITEYVAYLERYAQAFSLLPHVRFQTRVVAIERAEPGYAISVEGPGGGEVFSCDAALVCGGLHQHPHLPEIPGLEGFTGEQLHSSRFRSAEPLRDRDVLIVGAGETATDIAWQASKVARSVSLSHRSGFLSVPKALLEGVPLDVCITNVFESSYQHPLIERLHVKWHASTPFIQLAFLIASGTTRGYGQRVATKAKVRRGYHWVNKSTYATPLMNRSLTGEPGAIGVFPQIEAVDGPTVRFVDGRELQPDVVLLATGYRPTFSFVDLPADRWVRHICDPAEPGLGFLGLARPNVGAIPPLSELQAMWWLERVRGRLPDPLPPAHYSLLSDSPNVRRFGVDYGAYMHALARDMDAIPGPGFLLRHPRAGLAYAIGQAFVTFFRLEGPYRSDEALRIAEDELLHTVRLRGPLANAIFVWVTFVFALVNAAAWGLTLLLAPIWGPWWLIRRRSRPGAGSGSAAPGSAE